MCFSGKPAGWHSHPQNSWLLGPRHPDEFVEIITINKECHVHTSAPKNSIQNYKNTVTSKYFYLDNYEKLQLTGVAYATQTGTQKASIEFLEIQ